MNFSQSMSSPVNEAGEHAGAGSDSSPPHIQLSLKSQPPPVSLQVLDKNITITFVAAKKTSDASTQSKIPKKRTKGIQTGEYMPTQPIMTIYNRKTRKSVVRRMVSDDWFGTGESSSDNESPVSNFPESNAEKEEESNGACDESLTILVHIAPSVQDRSSSEGGLLGQTESGTDQVDKALKLLEQKSSTDTVCDAPKEDCPIVPRKEPTPEPSSLRSTTPSKEWSPQPGPSGLCKFKDTKLNLSRRDYESSSEDSRAEFSKYYDPYRIPSGIVIRDESPSNSPKRKVIITKVGNPTSKPPAKRPARTLIKTPPTPVKRNRRMRLRRNESPSPRRRSPKMLTHNSRRNSRDYIPIETRQCVNRSKQKEPKEETQQDCNNSSSEDKKAKDSAYRRIMMNKIRYLKRRQKREETRKKDQSRNKQDSSSEEDNDEAGSKRKRTKSE